MTALQQFIKRMQDYDGEAIEITSKSDIRLCKGDKLIAFPGTNSNLEAETSSGVEVETTLAVETTIKSLEYVYDFCQENGYTLWCWFIREPEDVDSYWYFELESNKNDTGESIYVAKTKEITSKSDIRQCKGTKMLTLPGTPDPGISITVTTESLENIFDWCSECGHTLKCWFFRDEDMGSYWDFALEFNKTSSPGDSHATD